MELLGTMVILGAVAAGLIVFLAARRHEQALDSVVNNRRHATPPVQWFSDEVLSAEREYEEAKAHYRRAVEDANRVEMRIRIEDAARLGKRWRNGTMTRPDYPELHTV